MVKHLKKHEFTITEDIIVQPKKKKKKQGYGNRLQVTKYV